MGPEDRERFLVQMRDEMRAGFQAADRRFDAIDQRSEAADRRFDMALAENRRYFDVIAETLQHKIELVIEGLSAVDQKVDRLRGDVQTQLLRLDRRLMRVSARIRREERD